MSLLQNEDHKTEAALIAAGGAKSQLLNDTKIYVTGNAINKTLDDAIVDGDIGGGGAATDVIYVDDDFESGVTDYTASGAGLTVSQETTDPLVGTGSLKIAKDAVNRTGVYVHRTDFTIDEGYQHSMLTLTFNATTSANYADEDIKPIIYDVENSQEIAVIPEGLLAGESGKYSGQFQTAAFGGGANEGDYELRFVVNSTNASAYDVIIDNVKIAPTEFAYGLLGNTQYSEANGDFTITGTNWTTDRAVAIPYKTKDGIWRMRFNFIGQLSSAISYFQPTFSGVTFANVNGSGDRDGQAVISVLYQKATADRTTSTQRAESNASTLYLGSGSSFDQAMVSGDVELDSKPTWAIDNYPVQLGSDAGTRVVSFRVSQDTGQTITAHTEDKVELDTVEHDTYNAWDSTNFKYIIPESGKWKFSGMITNAAYAYGGANYYYGAIQKNGTNISRFYIWVSAAATGRIDSWNTNAEVDCEANDEITLVMYQTAGSGWTTDGVTSDVYLEGHKIQGPQQIAASEKVTGYYNTSSGQTITSTASTLIFTNKIKDSHNSFNTSNGELTIKRSGDLSLNCWIWNTTASSEIYLTVKLNGTAIKEIENEISPGTRRTREIALLEYPVEKDDVITVQASSTTSTTITTSPNYAGLSFKLD